MGRPGRLGSELMEGRPGIELFVGRLGSELRDGTLGREPTDGSPEPEPVLGRPGSLGTEVSDPEGGVGTAGRLGTEPAAGRLGTDGGVTQICSPLLLEAVRDPAPAEEVTLALPDVVAGVGTVGVVGVLTHCFPVGSVGNDVGRLGTDVGSDVGSDVGRPGTAGRDDAPGAAGNESPLWLAPLGKALAAPMAMAATPAAPAVRRMIRP
jgi:hypothetical protein